MNNQSRAFIEWQERLVAGEKPTIANFIETAFAQDPPKPVMTQVARLDPRRWGFKTSAEMDAAFAEEEAR